MHLLVIACYAAFVFGAVDLLMGHYLRGLITLIVAFFVWQGVKRSITNRW